MEDDDNVRVRVEYKIPFGDTSQYMRYKSSIFLEDLTPHKVVKVWYSILSLVHRLCADVHLCFFVQGMDDIDAVLEVSHLLNDISKGGFPMERISSITFEINLSHMKHIENSIEGSVVLVNQMNHIVGSCVPSKLPITLYFTWKQWSDEVCEASFILTGGRVASKFIVNELHRPMDYKMFVGYDVVMRRGVYNDVDITAQVVGRALEVNMDLEEE